MDQPTPTLEGTLRTARMVHGVLLFSMLLYVYMGEIVTQHEPRDPK